MPFSIGRTTILLVALFFLLFTSQQSLAQVETRSRGQESGTAQGGTGTIRGKVVDKETGEALIGASVLVVGTQRGASTDLDGQYTITGVDAGTYDIKVTYIGYLPFTVTGVAVAGGQVTVSNGYLSVEGVATEEVVIEAKILRNTEASILAVQRTSSVVLDAVSSQQFTRNGDSDVASGLRRVVGITVEGGKYVYVRGLGDRYSQTLINGAILPGLDPNRNAVPIDIIPSNLIDNVLVYKSFSPDLPAGSFAGGLVDINTKDFPDKFLLQFSASASYNDQASFNSDYLRDPDNENADLDFLGFGNSDRESPVQLAGFPSSTLSTATPTSELNERNELTRQYGAGFNPRREAPPLDHSISFGIGNQKKILGIDWGYVASLSYRRQYNFFEGNLGRFEGPGGPGGTELTPRLIVNDDRGNDEVLWGALGTLSAKLNSNNKLTLTYMHNQSGEQSARILDGAFPANANNYFGTVTTYAQRSLDVLQIRGNHKLPGLAGISVDWFVAGLQFRQLEPNNRFFGSFYDLDVNGERINEGISAIVGVPPTRIYRELNDRNLDSRLNISIPLSVGSDRSSFIKFGGAYTSKNRDPFKEFRLDYNTNTSFLSNFDGDLDAYFGDDNLVFDPFAPNGETGIHIRSAPQNFPIYSAKDNVLGLYLMGDIYLSQRWRVVAGARYETTRIEVDATANDGSVQSSLIDLGNILPSINVTFKATENANFRFGYNRTLARPIFRELAPFETFDFAADLTFIGNPDLTVTEIDNFDLRYEYYPSPSEIMGVSLFFKDLSNPIERTFNFQAANGEATVRNVDQALAYGIEVEVKRNLSFLTEALRFFQVGVNVSYIISEVDVNEAEFQQNVSQNSEIQDTRTLFSQSPYVFNFTAGYVNTDSKTSAIAAFNIWGERLAFVGGNGVPNVYEQPRPSLDLNWIQGFGQKGWSFRVGIQNLLNPEVRFEQRYRGVEYDFQSYREGRRFTLGISYSIQ